MPRRLIASVKDLEAGPFRQDTGLPAMSFVQVGELCASRQVLEGAARPFVWSLRSYSMGRRRVLFCMR